jgi:hypothetical protein
MKSVELACIVSGRIKKYYIPLIKKKLQKYGSLDEYRKFVCREAKKLLKKRIAPEVVQKQLLPKNTKPFTIDLKVLARLKLLKTRLRAGTGAAAPATNVSRWRIKDVVRSGNHFTTKKAYIEWLTGGDNQCQVPYGGTCWWTQLRIDNGGYCDKCEFVEHCLCRLRKTRK